MAQFKIPYQNIEYWIPDDGESFVTGDGRQSIVGVRRGNTLYTTSVDNLRNMGGTVPSNATRVSDVQSGQATQVFGQTSGFSRAGTFTPDMIPLLNSTPQRTGEVVTQNISAGSPHAAVISSNFQGTVSDTVGAGANPNASLSTIAAASPTGSVNAPPLPTQPKSLSELGFTEADIRAVDFLKALNQGISSGSIKSQQDISGFMQSQNMTPMYPKTPPTTSPVPSTPTPVTTPGAISSTSVANSSAPNLGSPTYPQPYDISSLFKTPELKATQGEASASNLSSRLQDLNSSLVGKTAYQQEQERLQGIPGYITTQNDLSAKLAGYETEMENLKLRAEAVPLELQEASTGRGRTSAGIKPLEASELRKNTIQRLGIASSALTTQSLLEATKGKLSNAQYLAKQAVDQKYAPMEEEIQALTNNYNLIIKSPQYSIEQKNAAQSQLDQVNYQKYFIDLSKQNTEAIQKIAIEAAALGNVPTTVLDQIVKSTDAVKAAQLAAPFERAVAESRRSDTKVGGTPLSILDIARYQSLYPDAGVIAGDSEVDANTKVVASSSPAAQTRRLIVDAYQNGNDYEAIRQEIMSDRSITDKITALQVLDEVTGGPSRAPENTTATPLPTGNWTQPQSQTNMAQPFGDYFRSLFTK